MLNYIINHVIYQEGCYKCNKINKFVFYPLYSGKVCYKIYKVKFKIHIFGGKINVRKSCY